MANTLFSWYFCSDIRIPHTHWWFHAQSPRWTFDVNVVKYDFKCGLIINQYNWYLLSLFVVIICIPRLLKSCSDHLNRVEKKNSNKSHINDCTQTMCPLYTLRAICSCVSLCMHKRRSVVDMSFPLRSKPSLYFFKFHRI